jgi:hypothetical protein
MYERETQCEYYKLIFITGEFLFKLKLALR